MFKRVLIANRGEIAVRIIRACHELGISTIAVVSEADRESLHAFIADEVVCIGKASPTESYLNIENILSAAITRGADAIHPGFGFLSENADFAEMCEGCGITFIGPSPGSIRMLGDKAVAKDTMKKAGVPVIPGSDGEVTDVNVAIELAEKIGFPLLIKASAGGGGRGIRLVEDVTQVKNAFETAQAEAVACFGYGGLYMERFLTNTRHIEFQIFADKYGHVVHLGERDCSMQRRNQKVLEEAPSVALTPELREKMGESAKLAAKAVGYKNTGTVEFLLAGNEYFFMEMNTRIQVEHPVTEMITGIDLVKEQILVAEDKQLSFTQDDIKLNGYAIECRINAENPDKNFMPTGGTVKHLHVPGGHFIRFDTHLYNGYKLPMNYDSMLGKLIVWAKTRDDAIAKMRSALKELVIDGVVTNADFQEKLVYSKEFVEGNYNTGFLVKFLSDTK